MEKPTSIKLRDAKESIIRTINEQNINPCIMKYIVREVYEAVCEAAETEYKNDVTLMNEQGDVAEAEDGEAIQQDEMGE